MTRPDLLCGRLLPSPASTSPSGSRDPVIQIRQTPWGSPSAYTKGKVASRDKIPDPVHRVIFLFYLLDSRALIFLRISRSLIMVPSLFMMASTAPFQWVQSGPIMLAPILQRRPS